MNANADVRTGNGRRPLSDDEFRELMREARAEARRRFLGTPPRSEPDFALRTQHAEFGAAAH
ncbi:hypothetical protein [Streptomyces venezuelae]|uniref:hypothetical protein n=1 Tax=Streptomyces venezuelae TaxID=54571 RepID=UPI00278C8B94|nr:hypothetical protein [Streptomyces venezuelae]